MITTRIHRTVIPITDITVQRLRGYVRTVHVAAARSGAAEIEVWYEAADIDEELEVRFWVHGTCHPFTHGWPNCPHVGTVTTHRGAGVWHVYAEYPLTEKFA